jgi:hypothetical protein
VGETFWQNPRKAGIIFDFEAAYPIDKLVVINYASNFYASSPRKHNLGGIGD